MTDGINHESVATESWHHLPDGLLGAIAAVLSEGNAGRTQNLERDLRIAGYLLREPRSSLTEMARAEDLTVERVRQVVKKIEANCRISDRRPASILRALDLIGQDGPLTPGEADAWLASAGLSDGAFPALGVIAAADLFGIAHQIVHEQIDGKLSMVGRRSDILAAQAAAAITQELVSKNGMTSVAAVLGRLQAGRNPASPALRDPRRLVEGVVARLPGRQDLDGGKMAALLRDADLGAGEEPEHFWINPIHGRRNHLASTILKIMSVARAATLRDLTELVAGIKKYSRTGLTVGMMRSIAYHLRDHLDLDGDAVRARDGLVAEDVLSDTEAELHRVLSGIGGAAGRHALIETMVSRGMAYGTVSVLLSYAPFLDRRGEGKLIRLVGAPERGEAAGAGSATSRVTLASGTTAGNPWAAYRINRPTLESGVINIPSSIRRHDLAGSWKVEFENESAGEAVAKTSVLFGLAAVFRAAGVVIGDTLRFEFDRRGRTIRIGRIGEADAS